MKIQFKKSDAAIKQNSWVVGVYQSSKKSTDKGKSKASADSSSAIGKIDSSWKSLVNKKHLGVLATGDFSGKLGATQWIYPESSKMAERILLVGLGREKDLDLEKLRQVGGTVAKAAKLKTGKAASFFIPSPKMKGGVKLQDRIQAIAEGVTMGNYHFFNYRKKLAEAAKAKISELFFCLSERDLKSDASTASIKLAITSGVKVGSGVNLAREVGNQPANAIGPEELAKIARSDARQNGLKCQILGDKELKAKGMGALLAVAQGSSKPARMIILENKGMGAESKKPPIVFVGKAITFDSGGISIKPSAGMQDMKFDMGGGAAVLGAMSAIGALGVKRRVIGIISAAENMPSGDSYRPGDILTSAAGVTIEVTNTDAEGRLALADALHLAQSYKPEYLVDLATLTGACAVALGTVYSGLFTRDDSLRDTILEHSEKAGEKLWPMPADKAYLDGMKSDYADIKNSGARYGGASSAAAFLHQFVADIPFAHLDIAGTGWGQKTSHYQNKGASGVGVRTLVKLAQS